MILPTKHIRADRALIGVGGEILNALNQSMTVSRLWDTIRSQRAAAVPPTPIAYEWFVLALDLLYLIGAVKHDRGLICKVAK
ncbi:MAG: hypothetical protein HQL69_20790 [Magnetococcales bacterium]|nr:hypothetical protein [Magnetococcales bacterium]